MIEELTLHQVCQELNETSGWVSKSLTLLKLSKYGRGKERLFTKDEVYLLKSAKMLRTLDYNWGWIVELKKREESVRDELKEWLEEIEKSAKRYSGIKLKQGAMQIQFLFLPPLEVPYSGDSTYEVGGSKLKIKNSMTGLANAARDGYEEIAKVASEYQTSLEKFGEFLLSGIYETEKK